MGGVNESEGGAGQWPVDAMSVEWVLRMTRTPLAIPSRGCMVQWFKTWTLGPAHLGQCYRARSIAHAALGRKKAGSLSPGLGCIPSAPASLYAMHSMVFMPRKLSSLFPVKKSAAED